MSDGRELIGHGTANGGAAMLGQDRRTPQLSLLIATATHWRPMDGQALEEFERD